MAQLPSNFVVSPIEQDNPPQLTSEPPYRFFADSAEEKPDDVFTQEELELINHWTPIIMGCTSPFLPTVMDAEGFEQHMKVNSAAEVLVHARGHAAALRAMYKPTKAELKASKVQERKARDEADKANKAQNKEAWDAYIVACKQRNEKIDEANRAWREAIQQRADALAQWDRWVQLKRNEYQEAKSSPIPRHPKD